jgi:hypothetical protein
MIGIGNTVGILHMAILILSVDDTVLKSVSFSIFSFRAGNIEYDSTSQTRVAWTYSQNTNIFVRSFAIQT